MASVRRSSPSTAIVVRQPAALARTSSGGRRRTRRLKGLRRRARSGGSLNLSSKESLIAIGVPAALQLLKKSGTFELPSIGGINSNLLVGGLLLVCGPDLVKGPTGRMLAAAGQGLAAVGAAECAQAGSIQAGSMQTIGDDEIGADDDAWG